jgi:hypothetical protein
VSQSAEVRSNHVAGKDSSNRVSGEGKARADERIDLLPSDACFAEWYGFDRAREVARMKAGS